MLIVLFIIVNAVLSYLGGVAMFELIVKVMYMGGAISGDWQLPPFHENTARNLFYCVDGL